MLIDYLSIEQESRQILAEIWKYRRNLWPNQVPEPIMMLCPEAAAKVLGVTFEYKYELGRFESRGDRFEVAGSIDFRSSSIAISKKFKIPSQRFTGAHEIGHFKLHNGKFELLHRDRPIDGIRAENDRRPLIEREADYFAACFLAPERLVVSAFWERFGKAPLVLDDEPAFWLSSGNPGYLIRSDSSTLDFPATVASASSYAVQHFKSLAKLFNVTVTTMAIRLRELELVRYISPLGNFGVKKRS